MWKNALCPSIPRRLQNQNQCPKLGRGCLFRIASNSGNGEENTSWNRSGIHNALFGVTCVCLDGKPHVNWLRRMDTSTQNGGHIGLRYLLPDHRPRIKVGTFALRLTCLVTVQQRARRTCAGKRSDFYRGPAAQKADRGCQEESDRSSQPAP